MSVKYVLFIFPNKSYRYFLTSDVSFCSKIHYIGFGGRTRMENSAHRPTASAFMR